MLHDHPRKPTLSRYSGEEALLWIGWLLIGTGVGCNEWVLTKIFSPDGIVAIQHRVAVWLLDILLLSLGLSLVKITTLIASQHIFRRLSQTSPRALRCSIGLVFTVLMLLGAEGIFYGLKHYSQEPVVEEVSWIRMPPPEEDGRVGVALPLPSAAFYVLLYPGVRRGKEMIPYFERTGMQYLDYSDFGAVPLSRETGFSPWEEGHDTKVVLLDPRYGL
jgi:hypothetical protein